MFESDLNLYGSTLKTQEANTSRPQEIATLDSNKCLDEGFGISELSHVTQINVSMKAFG